MTKQRDKIKKREYDKKYRERNSNILKDKKHNYYLNNKEKIRAKGRLFYKNNKSKWQKNRDKDRERAKIYREKNRQLIRDREKLRRPIIREQRRERYNSDKEYQMGYRLRKRLIATLKNYTQTGKIMESKKYGIEYKAIIEHLKPFPEDISKYHIDHIRPICSFKFVKDNGTLDQEQLKIAFAPENHQWLTKEENLRKITQDKLWLNGGITQ